LKSRAFYETALPYGQSAAEALVDYHKAHGGISRYRKFEYFLHKIVASGADGSSLEELVESFAGRVRELLEECEVAEGFRRCVTRRLECDGFLFPVGINRNCGMFLLPRELTTFRWRYLRKSEH